MIYFNGPPPSQSRNFTAVRELAFEAFSSFLIRLHTFKKNGPIWKKNLSLCNFDFEFSEQELSDLFIFPLTDKKKCHDII